MSNTHTIADTMAEIMAREEDLLPACVISTTWPTVPVSSPSLAAFTTQAYVRDGQHLVYCDQPAITLPLTGSAGTYWLAIARDVSTAYATWTRRAGSQYLWQLAGSRPPDVDGLLVFCSVTVAGGIITAVTPAPGVTRAERWRTLAALGTMAVQNASAVAIAGGSATFTGDVAVSVANSTTVHRLAVSPGATYLDRLGVGEGVTTDPIGTLRAVTLRASAGMNTYFNKNTTWGLNFFQQVNDAGGGSPIAFYNVATTMIGSVSSSGSTVSYNTTSDARLKHAIEMFADALDLVRQLRPVRFRWNTTDELDHGFLAHELQQIVPGAVTGQPDEVNPDGSIKPQQVDHSKLVVFLVVEVQELLKRVEALEELVTAS